MASQVRDTLYRELGIINEVLRERRKQEAKWGVQDHPSIVFGTHYNVAREAVAKYVCGERVRQNNLAWTDIAIEELAEAIEAPGEIARRDELIQLAAVVLAWIENIDRNTEQLHGELVNE